MSPATALTAPVDAETPAPVHTASRFAHVPLADVRESAHNPRKHWDRARDAELELSVRQHGVRTPILVRPMHDDGTAIDPRDAITPTDHYEIAAGHRRRRAAMAAGLTHIPAIIAPMTDDEYLELVTYDNLQREDIHPLDEADAYQALLDRDGAYTVEAIAHRIGKSESYVYQRLQLQRLSEDARAAFEREEITASHATRLARLTPQQQAAALPECFLALFRDDAEQREPAPVSKLDAWLQRHTAVAPVDDATRHYFPELAEALEREPEPTSILQVSVSMQVNVDLGSKDHGVLGPGRWREVRTRKERCPHTQRAVIVHGTAPRLIDVCATKTCAKHWPQKAAAAGPTPDGASPGAGSSGKSARAEQDRRQREEEADRSRRRDAWMAVLPSFVRAAGVRGARLSADKICQLVIGESVSDTQRQLIAQVLPPLAPDTFGAWVLASIAANNAWSLDCARSCASDYGIDITPVDTALQAVLDGQPPPTYRPEPLPAARTARTRATSKTTTAKRGARTARKRPATKKARTKKA